MRVQAGGSFGMPGMQLRQTECPPTLPALHPSLLPAPLCLMKSMRLSFPVQKKQIRQWAASEEETRPMASHWLVGEPSGGAELQMNSCRDLPGPLARPASRVNGRVQRGKQSPGQRRVIEDEEYKEEEEYKSSSWTAPILCTTATKAFCQASDLPTKISHS